MVTRIAKFSLLMIAFTVSIQTAAAADKDKYRPEQQHYPQIIHASDYSTIEAIGNIVTELQALPKGKINCSYDNGVVSMQSAGDIEDISTYDREVMVGERHYRQRPTLVYFNTLIKMVGDLSKTATCTVKYKQLSSHDYMSRVVIDFAFGPKVVELDAMSNGRENQHRVYTLDLVNKRKAYFHGS